MLQFTPLGGKLDGQYALKSRSLANEKVGRSTKGRNRIIICYGLLIIA